MLWKQVTKLNAHYLSKPLDFFRFWDDVSTQLNKIQKKSFAVFKHFNAEILYPVYCIFQCICDPQFVSSFVSIVFVPCFNTTLSLVHKTSSIRR